MRVQGAVLQALEVLKRPAPAVTWFLTCTRNPHTPLKTALLGEPSKREWRREHSKGVGLWRHDDSLGNAPCCNCLHGV